MRTPTSFGSDRAPRHRPAAVARPLALGGLILGAVLLTGCAADQPSGPLAPRDSTASQPLRRVAPLRQATAPASKSAPNTASTAPAPAPAATPAPTPLVPTVAAKPAPVPAPVQTAAKPASSPAAPQSQPPRTVRPPTPAAVTPAPVATRTPATPDPRPTEVNAPQTTRPPAVPAPASASTGDFSTALLFAAPPNLDEEHKQIITLCEFKDNRWNPVMIAPVQLYGDTRAVSFRAVPAGRMVVPMYMVGDEPYPAANPWMIESTGKARELKGPCATCPSDEPPIMALEIRPGEVGQKPSSEPGEYGVMAVRAEPYRRYTLSYWDAKWVRVGEVVLGDQPARIEGVPGKRVLWLDCVGGGLTLPVVP